MVHVTGDLQNLSMQGEVGGMWNVVDGHQKDVFGLGKDMDQQVATNQLRTALVHEITLMEHRSTFPVPLGVSMAGIEGGERTDAGESFLHTVLPFSVITTPQQLHKCDTGIEEGAQWRKNYPNFNATNIETEGILPVQQKAFVFVHEDHPIIDLLRHNMHLIGCDIDKQEKFDNNWFKVSKQVVSQCCKVIRETILNKISAQDLNVFNVKLTRLNANGWEDVRDQAAILQNFKENPRWTAEELESAKGEHVRKFLMTPYSYHARIQIKYEIQSPQ
jgi:hypothetical protein